MTLENLLIFLAVVAVAFVNVVLPWLRKRREGGQAGEPESEVQEEVQEDVQEPTPIATMALPSEVPTGEPTAHREAPRRARVPLTTGMPPVLARRPRRSPVASLADARRGIVLRTILGPCRAQQPFDSTSN